MGGWGNLSRRGVAAVVGGDEVSSRRPARPQLLVGQLARRAIIYVRRAITPTPEFPPRRRCILRRLETTLPPRLTCHHYSCTSNVIAGDNKRMLWIPTLPQSTELRTRLISPSAPVLVCENSLGPTLHCVNFESRPLPNDVLPRKTPLKTSINSMS